MREKLLQICQKILFIPNNPVLLCKNCKRNMKITYLERNHTRDRLDLQCKKCGRHIIDTITVQTINTGQTK